MFPQEVLFLSSILDLFQMTVALQPLCITLPLCSCCRCHTVFHEQPHPSSWLNTKYVVNQQDTMHTCEPTILSTQAYFASLLLDQSMYWFLLCCSTSPNKASFRCFYFVYSWFPSWVEQAELMALRVGNTKACWYWKRLAVRTRKTENS